MKKILSFLIIILILSTAVLAGSRWFPHNSVNKRITKPVYSQNFPGNTIYKFFNFWPVPPPPPIPLPEDIPPDIFCPEPYEPQSCIGDMLRCSRIDVDGREVFINVDCDNGCVSTMNFAQCL